MPAHDNFYVIDFVNPSVDGHVHYMVMMLDSEYSLAKILRGYKLNHPHIQIDTEKKYPFFLTRPEAVAESKRLGDLATAVNPNREDANVLYPPNADGVSQANMILEAGKPETPI